MSLIERYTTHYSEELACKWCGLPLENDDYVYGGDVVCKGCYEMAYKGSTGIDYLIDLIQTGQTGSVVSFLKDLRNANVPPEEPRDLVDLLGEWIRGYFDEEYKEWVKF